MKLPVATLAVAVLAVLAGGAQALTATHLDAATDLVAVRLAALPTTGLDRTQTKQRKALLKAQAALASETTSVVADLAAARRAVLAVAGPLRSDTELTDALRAGLALYLDDADSDHARYASLASDSPLGRSRTKTEGKLRAAASAIEKGRAAASASAQATLAEKAAKALASARAALYDGDCPRYDGVYKGELGTVTYVVDGMTHTASDIDVSVYVDSDTGALLDLLFEARYDPGGANRETISVGLYDALVSGTGTYVDPVVSGPGRMSYSFANSGFLLQGFTASVTLSEFSYEPIPENAFPGAWGSGYKYGRGRIRGTFDITCCQTLSFPGPTCGGVSKRVTGSFDLCNPTIQER